MNAQNAPVADTVALEDRRLQAAIEALRAEYPDTQELYREVCAMLFFRHGITPTANKLYQLVRKGSMSAPAEALAKFWEMLREKSRVRIEHPDLPDELRDAAGSLIATLWQRAQAVAQDSLVVFRAEAQAAVDAAKSGESAAQALAATSAQALVQLRTELSSGQINLQEMSQDLAREQGARAARERQIEEASEERQALQRALLDARQAFEKQLEEQRAALRVAEDRHQANNKRALLEVDRERLIAAKLQKELDEARRTHAEQKEQHLSSHAQLQEELVQVRHQRSEAKVAIDQAHDANDKLRAQLDKLRVLRRPIRKVTKRNPR